MDLMVNATPVRSKEFNWNSVVNLNYNKNKILALGDTDADVYLYDWVNGGSILRVGESMGSFYGLQRYGVYTIEDFEAGNCEKNQVGRAKRSSEKRSSVKDYRIGRVAGSTISLTRILILHWICSLYGALKPCSVSSTQLMTVSV